MATSPTYREQYNRMKRWYERFGTLDQGRTHGVDSENYLDEIYAFFQNCYHLKDWIKNDMAVAPAIQQSVEGYINGSRPLRLAADICNSLKHLQNRGRSGEDPKFGRKHFSLGLGLGDPVISLKFE